MICIQKIYGFHGINRQNIEKSCYVTPVTDGQTDGGRRKVENRAVFCWTRNRKSDSEETKGANYETGKGKRENILVG